MFSNVNLSSIDNDAWLSVTVRFHAMADRLAVKRDHSLTDVFKHLETLVLFLGYPRSGHSIIGSVIDAHRNAVVSHRLDSLKYLESGLTPHQVFYLIWQNSQRFAAAGRKLTAYRYAIPNQWHGRFDTLRVIGDQEAKWTTLRLAQQPRLLERLRSVPSMRTRFIHVVRNPYDNITTWSRRTQSDLDSMIDRYFALCGNVATISEQLGIEEQMVVRHEEFVADVDCSLRRLCGFLGLEPSAEYLRDCRSVVYKAPNRTRRAITWPARLIDKVAEGIDQFPVLKGYCYGE